MANLGAASDLNVHSSRGEWGKSCHDDSHFAAIGRLDIVMVPIDGTDTMSLDGISDIVRRLRSSAPLR